MIDWSMIVTDLFLPLLPGQSLSSQSQSQRYSHSQDESMGLEPEHPIMIGKQEQTDKIINSTANFSKVINPIEC